MNVARMVGELIKDVFLSINNLLKRTNEIFIWISMSYLINVSFSFELRNILQLLIV